MGFGASKIDYKERNFTEQPLEKEEIDVLMKSIPKDDVLGSLNQEDKKMIINNYPVDDLIQRLEQPEREKIVKEIGNEKMFNLIGDRIFDYYFTNNKEDIKGCMKGHMNKDGTPCEDEKFKRMITTIPDLVQGPLGEKQIQWNTEKNTLNENYITLEDQKDSLQQNYDNLLSEKTGLQSQWDTEKTGLQSQWNTEKTNLETQWNTEKTGLETQWNTEKTGLESEITTLKSERDNLKEIRNTLKSERDNLLQGSGTATETLTQEKDKLQQNYDNLLSEKNTLKTDYDILESEKTNLETQWNTEKTNLETQWNTEKTNLESEKTNLESEITNLESEKTSLESEKTNLQTQWNTEKTNLETQWNTEKTNLETQWNTEKINLESEITSLESEITSLESEKTSLESEKTNLQTQWNTEKTNLQTQWNTEKNNLQTQWNTEKTTLQTKNDIFKTYFNTNFKKYISGAPNKNVSEQECKAYADYVGKPFSDAISSKTRDKWSNYIKGCQEDTTNVYWNPSISSTKRCGTGGYYCIQKPLTSEDLEEVSSGAPFLKFKEVRTGSPNKSVSKPECNEYALKIGYTWGGNSDDGNVPGCFVQKNYSTVYYNERDTSTNCQDINISTCIEKNDKHVNKEECKAYATDIRYTWGGNSNDGNVQGCFVQHDYNTVYYNEKDTSTNCQDISTSTCLKKK